MAEIKNKEYRQFIDKGTINLLELDDLKEALDKVDGIYGNHVKEGRALLIALYYTGGRPIEVLGLKGKDIHKQRSYIKIDMSTAKRGVPRTISLPYRFKYVKELYKYAQRNFREKFLFYNYRSNRVKTYVTEKGETKEYLDVSDKLRYYVLKWFGVPPYFLRHNRFSQLANAGLTPQDIQFLKGGRRSESVQPYLHLSTKKSEELAKKIK